MKKENIQKDHEKQIYLSIVSYIEAIYSNKKYNIKKDFNSSFEITVILLFIVFHSYKEIKNMKEKQKLMNFFINDLDISLRALGIGDMKIGKYVKIYVKKTYYRFKVLEKIFKYKKYEEFQKYMLKLDLLINNQEKQNNFFIKYFFNYIIISVKRSKNMNFYDFVFI